MTYGSGDVDWHGVGVLEYLEHNYTHKIFDEDRLLIERATGALRELRVGPASLSRVADIGAGPNLYPAFVWAPFVAPDGSLDLVEFSDAYRAYVSGVLSGAGSPLASAGIWDKYERCVGEQGPPWHDLFDAVRRVARVRPGSVFALPIGAYDAASTFFVAECATDDRDLCLSGIRGAVRSVRPGGVFFASHILGSTGMRQSTGAFYPAYPLTMDDLHEAYDGTSIVVERLTFAPETRAGYDGIAFAAGRVGHA